MMASELTVAEFYTVMGKIPAGNCDILAKRLASAISRESPGAASRCDWDAPALVSDNSEAIGAANALSARLGIAEHYGPVDAAGEVAVRGETGVRLATQEQWEWAASGAGRTRRWSGTDDIGLLRLYGDIWMVGDATESTEPTGVRRYLPNAIGLYDMSGNAPEIIWATASESEPHHLDPAVTLLRKGGRARESPTHSGRFAFPEIWQRDVSGVRGALRFVVDDLGLCGGSS